MIRYLIFAAILMTGCSMTENQRLADFNEQLGHDKSLALNRITTSFEDFLLIHYPVTKDFNFRFCSFIDDLAQNKEDYIDKFLLTDSLASNIIADYQNSGLAKELWISVTDSAYIAFKSGGEEEILYAKGYDPENDFDTIPYTDLSDINLFGAYHQALSNIDDNDFISNYVAARESGGDMSYPILISAFLDFCNKTDYNDPIVKRIVTLELFIYLAYLSVD